MDFLKPKIEINNVKYTIVDKIGEGAYAFVYKVKVSPKLLSMGSKGKTQPQVDKNEKYFAIKKLICQPDDMKEAKKEISFLRNFPKHDNVIQLLGSEHVRNPKTGLEEVFMLLPLYQTNVQSLIDKGKGFPSSIFNIDSLVMRNILNDCVNGLEAIHRAGYRHADFKPANILLNKYNRAVITDFGSVCPLVSIITSRSQALAVSEEAAVSTTASYRAPELFDTPSDCTIDGRADVWSFGCALYVMMYSKNPFESPREGLSTLSIKTGHYSIPVTKWTTRYSDIIDDCLKVDCSSRLTIKDLKMRVSTLFEPEPTSAELKTSDEATIDKIEINKDAQFDPNFANFDDVAVELSDEDEEFGDFESAPPVPDRSSLSPSSKIPSSITPTIKTVYATIIRPRGITRQLVSKPVYAISIPFDRVIIRKTLDPESKIYTAISLRHPVTIVKKPQSTDSSSSLTPYILHISGYKVDSNDETPRLSGPSSSPPSRKSSATDFNLNSTSPRSSTVSSTRPSLTSDAAGSAMKMCSIELGFQSEDLMTSLETAIRQGIAEAE